MHRRKRLAARAESFGGSLSLSSAAAASSSLAPQKKMGMGMGMKPPGNGMGMGMGGGPGPGPGGPGGPGGGGGPGNGGPGPGGPGGPGPGMGKTTSSHDSQSSHAPTIPSAPPTGPLPAGGGPTNWQVDFINNSNAVTDADLQTCIAALQKQVQFHFGPVWNINADLKFSTQLNFNPTIFVLDYSSDVSILGYHDITQAGIPVGFVFAQSSIDSGESWQVTASHELLELLGDPYVNLACQGQFAGQNVFFAYETCDAVENDVYQIDGVDVSNFQYPSWFVNQNSDRYDYMGVLDAPFTISSGGYLTYFRTVGDWIDVSSNGLLPLNKPKFTRHFRRRKLANPLYSVPLETPINRHNHVKD
jgi:hypothetical protein